MLASARGVQQGDPLGPLLFSLVWQSVPLAVKELSDAACMEGVTAWQSCYLDDGAVEGAQLAAALELVKQKAAPLGVEVNTAECRTWGPAFVVPSSGALSVMFGTLDRWGGVSWLSVRRVWRASARGRRRLPEAAEKKLLGRWTPSSAWRLTGCCAIAASLPGSTCYGLQHRDFVIAYHCITPEQTRSFDTTVYLVPE